MTTLFQNIMQRKLLFFIVSWLVLICLYLPSYKAGFVAEFISYLQSFEENNFIDFINRKDAYVVSFYQLSTLVRYICIALFGAQQLPWFLLFMAGHALIGTLVFRFFENLFQDFSLKNGQLISCLGTILFLLNPNISEVTVWKGTDHYYISIMIHLFTLIQVRSYLKSGLSKHAWYAAALFVLSAFAMEIFYIVPLLTLGLIAGYYWKGIIDGVRAKKALFGLFLPQVCLFLVYLVSFRMLHGSWIAHYGTTDEFVWSLGDILRGYGKYIGYLGIMLGHFPEGARLAIYGILGNPMVYYSIVFVLFGSIIILLLRFKKLGTNTQILVWLLAAFACSITLCLTTFFDDLFSMYNSRRCYHAGIFFYMAVALLMARIRNKRIALAVYGLYLFVCVLLTVQMIFRWRTAAKIQYGILRTFNGQKEKTVVILNMPTYFKDVRIIPASGENEFARHLKYFGYQPMEGKLYSVAGYNMNQPWDGVHVQVADSVTLKVTLNQWGCWWMQGYKGASNYETDLYTVELTDLGHQYLIHFKTRPDSNLVVLFQQDIQWRRVDWNRSDEQW